MVRVWMNGMDATDKYDIQNPRPYTKSRAAVTYSLANIVGCDFTVKPLLSGDPRDWAKWPLNRGDHLKEVP